MLFKIIKSITLRRIFYSNKLNKRNFVMEPSKKDDKMENTLDGINKLVYIDKIPYTAVTEGKAEVLFPSTHDVFYNPVQEFNRDTSIAIIKQFSSNPAHHQRKKKTLKNGCDATALPKLKILEALAASGLRSIRFSQEIPNLAKVIANDRATQAYDSIQRNIAHNEVKDIIEAYNEDATLLMYKNRSIKDRFDVVDLDPYGTAAPFLDAAVQCVADGGLLLVTCTDMAVLCGNGVEACHAKYGAVSIKIGSCHEMALRILLQSIESHANRYGRYIVPVVSLSVDFYVRVVVRIFTSPLEVKESMCKISMVYVCNGCRSFHLQPVGAKVSTEKGHRYSPSLGPPVDKKCSLCGHAHKVCGPIWSGRLHNKEFVQSTIEQVQEESDSYQTSKRMLGVLSVIAEELEDTPLYYKIEQLSSTLHVVSPTIVQLRSAVLNAGYNVSLSHAYPTSLKTDAPYNIIWDIMRAWAKEHLGKKTMELEPSKTIMTKESSIDVSFETHPLAEPKSRSSNMLRFQVNPPEWGPKCRSKTSLFQENEKEKRTRHQNKRKNKDTNSQNKKVKDNNEDISTSAS